MQSGSLVGFIIPMDTEIKWLTTPSEEGETIVEIAMSNESND